MSYAKFKYKYRRSLWRRHKGTGYARGLDARDGYVYSRSEPMDWERAERALSGRYKMMAGVRAKGYRETPRPTKLLDYTVCASLGLV